VPTAVLFRSGTNSVRYTKVTLSFAGEQAPSKKKSAVVNVRFLLNRRPSYIGTERAELMQHSDFLPYISPSLVTKGVKIT